MSEFDRYIIGDDGNGNRCGFRVLTNSKVYLRGEYTVEELNTIMRNFRADIDRGVPDYLAKLGYSIKQEREIIRLGVVSDRDIIDGKEPELTLKWEKADCYGLDYENPILVLETRGGAKIHFDRVIDFATTMIADADAGDYVHLFTETTGIKQT